jgi:hypothetical protein
MPTHVISANGQTADSTTGDVQIPVFKRKTILTDAQIKALPSTAVEVVPAQEGKVIMPIGFMATFKQTVGYTNTNPDTVVVMGWGDSGGTIEDSSCYIKGSSLEANGNRYALGGIIGRISANIYDTLEGFNMTHDISNKAIVLTSYNSGGDFTGGDASNTLEVTVVYSVVDL